MNFFTLLLKKMEYKSTAQNPRIPNPLTVKQFLQIKPSDNSSIGILNNQEIVVIEIVGIVTEVKNIQSGLTFDLFDGTATIPAVVWFNAEFDASRNSGGKKIEVGNVLKCNGLFSSNKNQATLKVNRFVQIEDLNALTTHFLQIAIRNKKNNTERGEMGDIETVIINYIKKHCGAEGVPKDQIINDLSKKYDRASVETAFMKLTEDMFIYCTDGINYMLTC